MAQVSFVLAVFFMAAATVVSAQDTAMTPAPSPDAGAAFLVPVSGAIVGYSLVISFLAFLRH
ncbi:hypothetical protein CsSME_00039524 [Camellia sinensis var. sinensis]